jgi:hypothetical protein
MQIIKTAPLFEVFRKFSNSGSNDKGNLQALENLKKYKIFWYAPESLNILIIRDVPY